MYIIDGVCWALLKLQRLDAPGTIYTNYVPICIVSKLITTEIQNQNKGAVLYIDERPKAIGNITRFIKITQPGSIIKQPNCIFEGHEGNHVFVCAIKSIDTGEGLLIN